MQEREWIMAFEPVIKAHAEWVKVGCATESAEPFGVALKRFVEEWAENGKPSLPPGVAENLNMEELRAAMNRSGNWWPPRYDTTPEIAYKLWPFIDALLVSWASIRNREPSPVETVAQLAKPVNGHPGVSNEQIAKIYGWFLPNGAPDTRKVLAELDKPGSQTDGGRYLPPDQREILARREGALANARLECDRRNAMLLSPREPVANVPELAAQKVSVGQMARMTGKTREEVRAMLIANGITDFVEDYSLDVVDHRHSADQAYYDARTMGVPLDRLPPGEEDDFSDDLLQHAAAAGLDPTRREG